MTADPLESRLLRAARDMLPRAYAPYSRFRVGAAVADNDGRIFCGCNIENASYGLTICAERVALGNAVAAGVQSFSALAIASDSAPPFPCGACRQVMAEFMKGDAFVLVIGAEGTPQRLRLETLLPHRFSLNP